MKEKNVSILIGLGIGGVISFIMLIIFIFIIIFMNQRIQSREQLIQKLIREGQLVEAVVAKGDIPKETIITSEVVKIKIVSLKTLQPGDLTSLDSVMGKKTTREIFKDQHVNADFLKISEKIDSGSVSKQEQP
ncbi:MAG: SAF domain-containing protein [Candidatus Omnitrophica bacterium]|jgi:flagella basal body P-ring formation protein FlgA|nr:SAF domain-containing protein [Candidatus Omnitrophota bacterium]